MSIDTHDTDNLISKKSLLAKYGISYGALYRWKRNGLIPEEWFIKRSTVTGQETFFPEALVTARIELIMSKKEDTLLKELAEELAGAEEADELIVLDTVFGEKSFHLSDIKSIRLMKDGREIKDLTKDIRKKFKKEND